MAKETRQIATVPWTPILFGLFVVSGCAYIVLAKLAHLHPVAITFVPVGIMIGYAAVQVLLRAARVRDDQAGDNLYYMGFLFTLTSLGVSLYQFDVQGSAETIVQNFGIAIGSTIAGVALRVFFSQMRTDPIEVEQTARLELAEAARRVRRQMENSVVEFGYLQRGLQQSLRDSFQAIEKDVEEISGKITAQMRELPDQVSGPITTASTQSTSSIEAMAQAMIQSIEVAGKRLSEESDRIATGAGTLSRALDRTVTKLDAMQSPDKTISIQIEPVAEVLTEAVERFASRADAQSAENTRIFAAIEAAGQDEQLRSARIESMMRALNQSANAMQETAARLADVASAMEGQTSPYGTVAE